MLFLLIFQIKLITSLSISEKETFVQDNPIIESITIHLKKFVRLPFEEIKTGTKMTDVTISFIYSKNKFMKNKPEDKFYSITLK